MHCEFLGPSACTSICARVGGEPNQGHAPTSATDSDSMGLTMRNRLLRTLPIVFAAAVPLASGCYASGPTPEEQKQSISEIDLAKDFWLNKRQLRAGLDHALKAVKLDDSNPNAAHLVGLIYLDFCSTADECRLEEAEEHVRRALELKEDYREARNTLGVILVHRKAYDDAISVLKPLSEDMLYRTPENAWGNLGWAYLESGSFDEAIDALRRSVAAQPSFCVGNLRLGLAFEKSGRFRESLDAYSMALDTDHAQCRGLQGAVAGRARMLLQLGHEDESRQDLQRCIELDKKSKAGQECRALLEKLG